MKGVAIPPIVLDITIYVLIVCGVIGVAMIVLGIREWVKNSRRQRQMIIKQRDDITGLERSLESLRQEYNEPYLIELPNKLTQIHQTLQSAARQVTKTSPDDVVLFEVLELWAARIGVRIWYKPQKGRFNKLLWKLQIISLLRSFKKVLAPVSETTMMSLYQLASDLDDKGVGLSSRLDNSYAQMTAELDNMLVGLGSQATSKYIQKYLLHSYGLNSLLLFWKYMGNPPDTRWLPKKFQVSEAFVIQITNSYMLNLRAEVVNHMQLYLLGKE